MLRLLIAAAMGLLPLLPTLAVVPNDQPYSKPAVVLEQLLNDAAKARRREWSREPVKRSTEEHCQLSA